MQTLIVLVVHAAGLGLTILSISRSGDRPQVLLYAFVLDYGMRLFTIYLLARRPRLAPFASSPPAVQRSEPLRYEGSAAPAGPSAYAVVVAFLGCVAFVLANVNQHHALDVDAATVLRDGAMAARLAAIYWIEGLLAATTIVDPDAPLAVNLGYNTREMRVLAFAVLTSGLVVMIRQTRGLSSSGWALLGPLLAYRTLYDVAAALRQPPA